MRWLRLYSEARNDRKLAILTLAERGVWVNLLCFANEQEERGTFDASDRYVLALECADGDEDVLTSALDKLLRVKHLTDLGDGRLSFRTFQARQYDKPSDAAEATRERKRKQRERAASHNDHDGNAMSRDVTRGHAPYIYIEGESDSPKEEDRESGDVGGAIAPVADVVDLSPLCAEIALTAGMEAPATSLQRLARKHGKLGRDAILLEVEKARDWIADTKRNKRKREMNVAFLDNWLTKAAQPAPQAQPAQITVMPRPAANEPKPLRLARNNRFHTAPAPLEVG